MRMEVESMGDWKKVVIKYSIAVVTWHYINSIFKVRSLLKEKQAEIVV